MLITPEEIQELLEYDAQTGKLFWKISPNFRIKVGSLAGTTDANGRVRVKLHKRLYLAHRLVWAIVTGNWPKNFLDHKDQDPSNNRFENLRECTKQENARNRKKQKNSSSEFVGVCWNKHHQKWQAQAMLPGKKHHLGYYADEVSAADAYDAFVKIHFGDFASLNYRDAA